MAIVVAVVLVVALSGKSPTGGGLAKIAHRQPIPAVQNVNTFGGVPSYLPKSATTIPAPRTFTASAEHPRLQGYSGDQVRVSVGGASAVVTSVGPVFPSWVATAAQDGKISENGGAPGTFYVSFSSIHGRVKLNPDQFVIVANGRVPLHPKVRVEGGGPLPTALTAGKPLKLELKALIPEESGAVAWAPDGRHVLALWEFQAEFD